MPALPLLALILLCGVSAVRADDPVRVEGATRAQEKNIRAWIGEPAGTGEAALRAFARRARTEAVGAMQALGYYHAGIEVRVMTGTRNGNHVRLLVRPGEPVRVGHITFVVSGDAADDGTYKQLRERWKLGPGDVFHHGLWRDTQRAVRELLRRRGYFDHEINAREARVILADRVVHLDLRIHSGPRFPFGETHFSGSGIDPELLPGYLPWKPGQGYDQDLVRRLERVLQDTQFFARIDVATTVQREPDQVRVDVTLESQDRNLVSIGPGVATDTGPRIHIGWEKPWIGSSGHALRTRLEMSRVRSQFDAVYAIPMWPPLSRSMEFNLNWLDEDVDDHRSERLRAAIQHRRLDLWGWETTHFLRVEEERFDTGNDRGQTLLLIPGTSWSRTRRQGGALASWGDRVHLELQGASEDVVSDLSFLRARLGLRWLRTLYANSRLQLRLDAGSILSDRFEDIPTSLRFFAGGDRSIRGFAYESLGPEDASGEVVGGRNLLVGSMELDWPVAPEWRAALFVDGGSAFDSPTDPYQVGFGGGARWLSPVGPVRLDLAIGLDESDVGFRFHFSLGPDL